MAADQRLIRQITSHYPRKDEIVSHVVAALNQYTTLHPEQSDFNYDDGRVELLLSIVGVIPVTLRGTVYNCPLAIWLPLDYPAKPPMVLITPTNTMQIKPGNNVDRNGNVSVQYLSDWTKKAEGMSLMPLLEVLTSLFGRDYPLVSIAQQPPRPQPPPPVTANNQSSPSRQYQSAPVPGNPVPPPRPPPPNPNPHNRGGSVSGSMDLAGPARPPYPAGVNGVGAVAGSSYVNGPGAHPGYGPQPGQQHALPPSYSQQVSPSPPPLPHQRQSSLSGPPRPPPPPNQFQPPPAFPPQPSTSQPQYGAQPHGHPHPSQPPLPPPHLNPAHYRPNGAPSPPPPPPPPVPQPQQQPLQQHQQGFPPSRQGSYPPHTPPSQHPYYPGQQPQFQQQRPQSPLRHSVPPPAPPAAPQPPIAPQSHAVPIQTARDPWQQQQQQQQPYDPRYAPPPPATNQGPSRLGDRGPVPPPKNSAPTERGKRVAVNILDDDLLGESNNELPTPVAAPPPRPPNPELLAIRTRLHSKLAQAMGALQSRTDQEMEQMGRWETDLAKGEPAILDEMQRLEAVRGVCQVVRDRYKEVVSAGEARLADYEARGEGPEVDEIVCSSTVVYNQLLELVAEEAALEDTIYHLGRGLNSETANIDLERFLRRVRGLAREQFIKRATINKILVALAARRAASSSAATTA